MGYLSAMRAVAVLCLTDLKAVDPHHDAIIGAGERRQDEKQYQSPELLFHSCTCSAGPNMGLAVDLFVGKCACANSFYRTTVWSCRD